MELYDKKYVYFEWDDKLEGKDVFCATSIEDLKSQVNYGNAQTGVLHRSNNLKGHPFVPTWSDGSGSMAYPFAYYDPNYEVKKAYNEGKKLQWKYRYEKQWHDWDKDVTPSFRDDTCGYELRVKPETVEYKEPEKDRYLTNKELTMWLAKGNGQICIKDNAIIFTYYCYDLDDDFVIDYLNIKVRKWEDEEWHEPTYNYCFGDK